MIIACRLFKLIALVLLITVSGFSHALKQLQVPVKVLCYDLGSDRFIPLSSQRIAVNFFEKNKKIPIFKTNSKGFLYIPIRYQNKQFRFNGYVDKNIIPGCNSGAIKKLTNGMHIKLRGVDCGVIPCSKSQRDH